MKKINFTILLFLLLFVQSSSVAQWSAGILANLKNDEPQAGIGFLVSRDLPFQWPVIGFKVRFDAGYFKQILRERYSDGIRRRTEINEKVLQLSLLGTLFFKNYQPYFAVGAGYVFSTAELNPAGINGVTEINYYSFLLTGMAGLQVTALDPVYPFIEIKPLLYFDELAQGNSYAKTFQITGSVGIRFEF